MRCQRGILGGLLIFSCALAAGAQAATGVIEEVVVTAQKREQGMQDVPIALSAFDTTFLEDAGIDDVFELQAFAPGLTVYNTQTAAQTNFNIRGVGTAGNSLSLESSVGVYVDGVYRSRQSSAIQDLVDLERVEVLKGPQGTLFGRNTAAGALQFITTAPDPDAMGGFLEVSGGNLDYRDFGGALNLPLVEGRVAARLTAAISERDGYVDNLETGASLHDRDRWMVRGQVLFTPNSDLEVRLVADASRIDERCCATANVFDGPADSTAAFFAAGGVPGFGLPDASFRLPIDLLGGGVVPAARQGAQETIVDIDPFAEIEESGLSAQVDWQIGDATLTSLTAWREYDVFARIDADFTSLDLISASGSTTDQGTFTQELRIAGPLFEGRTHYVAGLYYFDQRLEDDQTVRFGSDANALLAGGATLGQLLGGAPVCALLGVAALCDGPAFPANEGGDNLSRQEQRSIAAFAQIDHDLSDAFTLTLGLRYIDEEKDMDVRFTETIFTPAFSAFTVVSPTVPDVAGVRFDDQALTGTARLAWRVQPGFMAYVAYGRGYKSGGTNIDRIDAALTGAPLLFDPETSDAFEIGFKGDFLERRLRVNGAIHLTDFDDFQANTFVGTGFVLQNAGQIRTRGFELEVSALPVHWLALSAGLAYVDAEYETFRGGACVRTPLGASPDQGEPAFPATCDNSGNAVAGTPEWTAHASVQVERRIRDAGFAYGQLDVAWQDENPGGNNGDPNKIADDYTLTNLRLGYRFDGDRYDVSLWAKNLLDEDYGYLAFDSPAREGSLTGYLTEPRTWGATLRARF